MADDRADTIAFLGTVLEHQAAATSLLLAALGDRLGLWRELGTAAMGADELAAAAGLDARYVAEWLAAMAAAGYVVHDSATFAAAPGAATAFGDESSAFFVGGALQNHLGLLGVLDHVTEAFRTGEGVPYAEYPADVFEGMARTTAAAFEHALVPRWLPLVPAVEGALRTGADVLDVGCGQGRAVLALAGAFPASRFTGVDAHRPVVERARAEAGARQLAGRVRFEVADAAAGVPGGPYDVACLFDVLHDAADPPALLRAVRAALRPGGTLLLLEPNTSAAIEGNGWPLGAINYGMSVLYCMSVSLGSGGPGLGTCGTSEPVVRELTAAAGFTAVEEIPIRNLFNRLYACS